MTRLSIRHETRYTYGRPVSFGPHRLLLRPRDSHAIRLVESSLQLSPSGQTRWIYDAMGNCVCWFTPLTQSDQLTVVSKLVIDRFPTPLAPLPIDDPHTAAPIVYGPGDRAILDPFIRPATDDDDTILLQWLQGHMGEADEPVLDFLQRLNRNIHDELTYQERQAEGVQSPSQTLRLRSGSCRDFAWLMIEALRRLGYAARYIMGYLYSPSTESKVRGAGATHAWCEVFLPGLGWMEFDPTNGLAESADLIRVATVRTPQEASPVSGSIIGEPGGSNLFVSVNVDIVTPAAQVAA
jgi:transglutaminase-like putative cysteine protease